MNENKNHEPVSFQVFEGTMTRMDRSNKRLLIALVVAVIVMLLNNLAWITYENHRQDIQAEQVTYETEEGTK